MFMQNDSHQSLSRRPSSLHYRGPSQSEPEGPSCAALLGYNEDTPYHHTKSSDALIDYFASFCSYRLSYRLLLLWCHSVSIQGERLAPSLPWIQSSVTPFAEMLHDKTPMY